MVSCLTLMPVISVKAFASVRDSYSWVVMVSETILMSMPLKGSAAFANQSSSFFWSSFDKVEGWNSLSIHFWIVASSARAGKAIVIEAAISAVAMAMVIKRFLVERPVILRACRMLFLRCSDRHIQARVAPGSALFRLR